MGSLHCCKRPLTMGTLNYLHFEKNHNKPQFACFPMIITLTMLGTPSTSISTRLQHSGCGSDLGKLWWLSSFLLLVRHFQATPQMRNFVLCNLHNMNPSLKSKKRKNIFFCFNTLKMSYMEWNAIFTLCHFWDTMAE